MAILTIHHWSDIGSGLREMRRVSRRRIIILTWIPEIAEDSWLTRDYLPEILSYDRRFFPRRDDLMALLATNIGPAQVNIVPIPIPHDCADGFLGAYWRRPEAYLDFTVRSAISRFRLLDAEGGLAQLRGDLENGRWTARNGHLLDLTELDIGYRLLRCELVKEAQ